MIKKYLNKLIICSLLITIIIVSVACGKSNDKKLEYDENDEIVKIDAQHTIVDEDLNIYVPAESVEKAQLPKRPVSHVQSFLQPRQRLLCLPDGTENGIYPTGKGLYGRWLPTDSQHL